MLSIRRSNFKDSWQKDEALKTLVASVFKDTHCHPQDETSVPRGRDRAEMLERFKQRFLKTVGPSQNWTPVSSSFLFSSSLSFRILCNQL
ncbi:hypothetical protein KI387_031609, partial [Taxus chinensis]